MVIHFLIIIQEDYEKKYFDKNSGNNVGHDSDSFRVRRIQASYSK